MKPLTVFSLVLLGLIPAQAAEQRLVSPDKKTTVVVSDGGLRYRIEREGKLLVEESALGLEFENDVKLGPAAEISKATPSTHDGKWEDRFGNRRIVPDRYAELELTLTEKGKTERSFGLIVRAYDDGVAFRYVLPKASKLGNFVLTDELTEFRFAAGTPCMLGSHSECAESLYPLSAIDELKPGNKGVVPLLAQASAGFAVISESDVRDWAAMFVQGAATGTGARVNLADRLDKRGKVVSQVPRNSPWRVIMIGSTAKDLIGNDLINTLATPSVIGDSGWVKPGAGAWDAWWTGVNPHDPGGKKGVDARGTTESHKEYITLAAEMGWSYQVMDWYWYKNMTDWRLSLNSPPKKERADFTKTIPEIDLPEIFRFAKTKNVRLLIWAHSLDIETFGIEKSLSYLASQGFAGVKIDFINDQSQETIQWCERVLATAAKHHLLIDFHGTYHPTGLARTYPNFITQEGVRGQEYDKLGNSVVPTHGLSLAFNRGLIGPMDYTPGGFLNQWPHEFQVSSPSHVQGSRARSLALPVIYLSPLTIFCDSPVNYHDQPGLEFYRGFPAVWDDTVALSADIKDHVAIARRSGSTWRIGAINGDQISELTLPLDFLGQGEWVLDAYNDDPAPGAPAVHVIESTKTVKAGDKITVRLSAGGGYAAKLTRKR